MKFTINNGNNTFCDSAHSIKYVREHVEKE